MPGVEALVGAVRELRAGHPVQHPPPACARFALLLLEHARARPARAPPQRRPAQREHAERGECRGGDPARPHRARRHGVAGRKRRRAPPLRRELLPGVPSFPALPSPSPCSPHLSVMSHVFQFVAKSGCPVPPVERTRTRNWTRAAAACAEKSVKEPFTLALWPLASLIGSPHGRPSVCITARRWT